MVGLGMGAQQVALGLYKVGLPFLAGFTTIPLVFGLTYAVGGVMDLYFKDAARGRRMDPAAMKQAWKVARAEGAQEAKRRKRDIKDEKF